ncbi:MAG: hypothetical protein AAF762_09230 [Pseudomonadota bacterium]
MSNPTAEELDLLHHLAALKADRARAEIAHAKGKVLAIEMAISDLRRFEGYVVGDPATAKSQERWLAWRHMRLAELNRDLALARATVASVTAANTTDIAREEVLDVLRDEARRDERRRKAAQALEALATAPRPPGGRYP